MSKTLILWVITVWPWLVSPLPAQEPGSAAEVMSSCKATAQRDRLDGTIITMSGIYGFGPTASADAPALLRDLAVCDIKGGFQAVLADTSNIKPSPAANQFRALQNDLVRRCKPGKCAPDQVPRYLYADIVVRGRLSVVPEGKRDWGPYCCRLEIEDVVSVVVGPETPKRPKLPRR